MIPSRLTPRRPRFATSAALLTVVGVVMGSASAPWAGVAVAEAHACEDAARAVFTDVAAASVHARGVDCLAWYGVTSGTGFDRFGASSILRRGEFASLVDRTLRVLGTDLPDPESPRFTDVSGVHATSIERLAEAGIVQGRTHDEFAPRSAIQRDQLATMLVRTYRLATGTEPADASHGFRDLAGNHHEPMIAQAVGLGLVHGRSATTYDPLGPTSRAQVATVLAHLLDVASPEGDAGLSAGGYQARVVEPPGDLVRLMERTTWRSEDCPVGPDELSLLEVVHTDFAGTDRWGQLVVHREVADDLVDAFGQLYDAGFPIEQMRPVERFGGDDDASMAANNTSAFNCRGVTGGTSYSHHSYGWAIDVNPVQNPYVRGDTVQPDAGRDYLDRDDVRPGMLTRPGTVEAFDAIGWHWGGDWQSLKDYQHVSLTGH